MKLSRIVFALSLVVVTGLPAGAAEPVSIGVTDSVFSKVLEEERGLMVYLPDGYAASAAAYPVLYLLDTEARFHHTTGTVAALSRIGHIPELIVVGVRNTDRTRDLTPPWTRPVPEEAPAGRGAAIAAGGGADDFLRFLREELIPHVEGKYRTAPYRILVGHSFGGLFAVHSLVSEPELFDAVLAISPSLWWNEGETVQRAKKLFAERPDLSASLFVTLADEGGDMLEEYRNFETLLRYRAPAGVRWHARVVDGEDHGSIPIPSVHAGLKAFFPRWQLPAFVAEEGLAAADAHYAALSSEYGYSIAAPEATLNNLGYQALAAEEVERAIEILRANVERYPDSSNVYDSLGEALEAAGQLAEARELYLRAYQTSEGRDDPNRDAYKAHLDGVTARIAEGR